MDVQEKGNGVTFSNIGIIWSRKTIHNVPEYTGKVKNKSQSNIQYISKVFHEYSVMQKKATEAEYQHKQVKRIGIQYSMFQVIGTLHTISMTATIRKEINILNPLMHILIMTSINFGIYTLETIGLLLLITLTLCNRHLLKNPTWWYE